MPPQVAGRRCADGHVRGGGDVAGGVGGAPAHGAILGLDELASAVADADDLQALSAAADLQRRAQRILVALGLQVVLLLLDLDGEGGEALGTAEQQEVAQVLRGLDAVSGAVGEVAGEAQVPAAGAHPAADERLGVLEALLGPLVLAHGALGLGDLVGSNRVVVEVDGDEVAIHAEAVAVGEVVEQLGVEFPDPYLDDVVDDARRDADAAVELRGACPGHLYLAPPHQAGARELLRVGADLEDVDGVALGELALGASEMDLPRDGLQRRDARDGSGLGRGRRERPSDHAAGGGAGGWVTA